MSLRFKVYSLVAILALLGGGFYIYKTKPAMVRIHCSSQSDRRSEG